MNIKQIFWTKCQEHATEEHGSLNAYGEYLSKKHGVGVNLSAYRRVGRLLSYKFIKDVEKFMTDDEMFIYANELVNASNISEEGEDFISDYVTGLNISQELKEYTRIKRKEQRRKMIEAINKEREDD